MRSRQGALTLAEVLVGAALLALLVAVAVRIFVPALGAWTRAQARSRAQQTVLAAARWIRTDLQEAAPASVGVRDGVVFMVTPADPVRFDQEGMPLWARQIVYWHSQDRRLHRQVVELSPAAELPELALPANDPSSRVVAQDIEDFQAELPRPGAVRFQLTAACGPHRSSLATTAASFYPTPAGGQE